MVGIILCLLISTSINFRSRMEENMSMDEDDRLVRRLVKLTNVNGFHCNQYKIGSNHLMTDTFQILQNFKLFRVMEIRSIMMSVNISPIIQVMKNRTMNCETFFSLFFSVIV